MRSSLERLLRQQFKSLTKHILLKGFQSTFIPDILKGFYKHIQLYKSSFKKVTHTADAYYKSSSFYKPGAIERMEVTDIFLLRFIVFVDYIEVK